jgi:hypothetical protein
MLCLFYYCSHFLFNKIRDKGEQILPGIWGGRWKGVGEEMAQTMYAHMNKQIKKKKVNKNKTQ